MANHEPHTWASLTLAVLALLVFGAAATQIAFGWPFPARYIGPALLALSIHGALVLAFLAGDLWRSAALGEGNVQGAQRAVAVAAALAGWAGIWLGARNGLFMLAAGHTLLAFYWVARGGRAGIGPSGSLAALFCAFNAAALATAAWLGPF